MRWNMGTFIMRQTFYVSKLQLSKSEWSNLMNQKKKVLFITGTRADYGKIKSLMKTMDQSPDYDVYIYVSGMHLLPQYGSTYKEVLKDHYENVHGKPRQGSFP